MIYNEPFVELEEKPGGRFLIVGDVHGQMDMLMRLLALVEYNPEIDQVVCVGDVVDRGLACAEVLRWFAEQPSATCLLGNHEALMLDAEFVPKTQGIWMRNGGDWAEKCEPEELDELRRLASQFPLAAQLNLLDGRRIGVVHAEVLAGLDWDQVRVCKLSHGYPADELPYRLESGLLWSRLRFAMGLRLDRLEHEGTGFFNKTDISQARKVLAPIPGIDLVFGGHTIARTRVPTRLGSHVFIDTGAYEKPNGLLTIVDPAADTYWQVGHEPRMTWGPLPLPDPIEKRFNPESMRGEPAEWMAQILASDPSSDSVGE